MTPCAVLVPIPADDSLSPPQRVEQQRTYARKALQRCAALCGAPPAGWRQAEDGAPLPNAGFYWSISHKRGMAAAVIADHRVGIDVECIVPRRIDLFRAVAADDEWALLPDRSWHSFFRVFTAKEATVKAHGLGIGHLTDCRILAVPDSRRMHVRFRDAELRVEHYEYAEHIAAVASSDTPPVWHVTNP